MEVGTAPTDGADAQVSYPQQLSRCRPSGSLWLTVLFATALSFLVVYSALIALLYAGPSVGDGMSQRHDAIRAYLTSPLTGASEDISFLDERERSHIRDVKLLFDSAFVLASISCALLAFGALAARARRRDALLRELGRVAFVSGLGTISLVAMLGLMASLSFDRFWIAFHSLLFPQGNWKFPYESALIRTYPETYFQGFVFRWVAAVVLISLLLVWAGQSLRRVHADEAGP